MFIGVGRRRTHRADSQAFLISDVLNLVPQGGPAGPLKSTGPRRQCRVRFTTSKPLQATGTTDSTGWSRSAFLLVGGWSTGIPKWLVKSYKFAPFWQVESRALPPRLLFTFYEKQFPNLLR